MARFVRAPVAGISAVFLVALSGCGGGQQEPAESPEPAAMPEAPPAAEGPPAEHPEGTHTMPDGSTMPGEHHEEGASPGDTAPKEGQ